MSSPCHFLQGKRKGEETNGDGDSNERFLEPGGIGQDENVPVLVFPCGCS